MKKLFIICILFSSVSLFAQKDSLVLINGDVIVGETKAMDKGVISIETPYSDSDFKIEWEGIKELYIQTRYNVTLRNGDRYTGSLRSVEIGKLTIISEEGEVEVSSEDIVYLREVEEKFLGNVTAYIDIGLSLSQANSLTQFTTGSFIGYMQENWTLEGAYNTLQSTQDDADDIRRTDGNLNYNLFLNKTNWYWLVQSDFLSNTEQLLNLRATGKTGLGNYLYRTNTAFWRVQIGAAFVDERFSSASPTEDRVSWEAFIGSTLNLYDIGDLSLLTGFNAFPGITERGRFRGDFNFDLKYDLPLDFYIGLGYRINYDNQPAENASETDWVFQTTFGWEL
jgi:hypothetical protein